MTGTVLPGFRDAHVHLSLFDPTGLAAGGIARVLDLGGWPPPSSPGGVGFASRTGHGRPHGSRSAAGSYATAVQFLTAPGGYPGRASWAPPGSVCEVPTAADAPAAVDRQLAAGASVIKVTLNSSAGPVLPDEVLAAIVARAHEHRAAVVAHAEGTGQAVRAFTAGVDAFAHAPFSERLAPELIDAMAGRMIWISTLDIHGWGEPTDNFARASANLARFHAAGGRVLYGTDLGNGPLPVGLNRREVEALLAAGLGPDAVLESLTGDTALVRDWPEARVSYLPGERPTDPEGFVDWLCTARAITLPELEVHA